MDQESVSEVKEMSFLDHLEELRWHIIRSGIAIVAFSIIAFIAKPIVFGVILLGPSRPDFWTYRMFCELSMLMGSDAFCIDELPFIIQSRQMTGQFTMHITSSVVLGIIAAFPYTFWEIWRFISPGLYFNERKLTTGAVFFVSLLFASGILFGYFLVTPISINFLSNYQLDSSIQNEFDIISYVSTVTMLVLACGLMFQLPMVVYFFTKLGVVTPAFLRTYRKHSVVIILVISAIITPPDVISQLLISFPLFFLYEISILISAAVIRKRKKKAAKEEAEYQKNRKN